MPPDVTSVSRPVGDAMSDLSDTAKPEQANRPDPDTTVILPDQIGAVTLEFRADVNREVKQSLVDLLEGFIRSDCAPGFTLLRLYIYSANDKHALPSRHAQGRAVDISRINGKRMSVHYPRDPEVRAITDALIVGAQMSGPTFVAREIFGPGDAPEGVMLKLGAPKSGVAAHTSHIHLSEGDRASIVGCPWHGESAAV